MKRAMQLWAGIFGVCAVALVGCASNCPAPAAKAAQAPVVSTTRLTSAELPETEFAPLVGKPQLSAASAASKDDELASRKDGRRTNGSGFSGYK